MRSNNPQLLPGFTHIELDEEGAPFDAFFASLAQNHQLESILFQFTCESLPEILEDFAATLVAAHLPALRLVEVCVPGDLEGRDIRTFVHAQLPRLHKQGFVTFGFSEVGVRVILGTPGLS